MSDQIKFKNEPSGLAIRLNSEYAELNKRNRKLLEIFLYANAFAIKNFNKPIIITHIFRTNEEQDQFYAGDKKYSKSPWKSEHQFWRGLDGRSSDFSDEELQAICDHVNKAWVYDSKRPELKTVSVHTIGRGTHLHFKSL